MNKKRTLKIIAIVLTSIMLVAVTTSVFAGTSSPVTPDKINGTSNVNVTGITNIGNSIVRILSTIGIVVSVIVLIVLGIKYMMGSAEEKAEYKKTMIPYIIGAGLVFAASTIATVVYNFMQNL